MEETYVYDPTVFINEEINNEELDDVKEFVDISDYYGTDRNMNSFSLFLKDLAKYKLKSPQEQLEVLRRLHQGDYAELNDFLCENMRLVILFAKKFYPMAGPIWEINDLVQEGFFGLREAALRYNPDNEKNATFSTYASFWIQQRISRFLDNKSATLRVPVHNMSKYRSINRHVLKGYTLEEACDMSGMKLNDYHKLYAIMCIYSLNNPISVDEGCTEELINLIQDKNTDIEKAYMDFEDAKECYEVMKARLNEKELEIISRRIGLFGLQPETLESIGQALHITRERVRQIEKKAYEKIRIPIAQYLDKPIVVNVKPPKNLKAVAN